MHKFIFGLNLVVFEDFVRDYNTQQYSPGMPTSLAEAMSYAQQYQQRVISVNPALGKAFDHSVKSFIAYTTEEVEEEKGGDAVVPEISSLATKPICQLCEKTGHVASSCFQLRDSEFVKQMADKMGKRSGKGMKNKSERHKPETVPATVPPPTVPVVSALAVGTDEAAFDFDWADEDALSICALDSVPSNVLRTVDLEHDDHAQVSVMNSQHLWMFQELYDCDDEISGVVPGAKGRVKQRGILKYDLGEAVVIPLSRRLLASGSELREKYSFSSDGESLKYIHKCTGAVITFHLDEHRYRDKFFHCQLSDVNEAHVASVDFYNPAPLVPVDPSDATRVWILIAAVERFHWQANHMSVGGMTRMCAQGTLPPEITVEAIKLFATHRGCSACRMGMMPGHSQLTSSRGLCTVVGQMAQGDVFFIEYMTFKVPVLLIVCEASMFIYMHTFLDAAARAHGSRVMVRAEELHDALEGVIRVWENSSHKLRALRFDRESSITSTRVRDWLEIKGVELSLTGAGHKLGLAEVCGRIVKERCRATVAGIKEKFGYAYPTKWFVRLVGDTVCIMNRSVRVNCVSSPSQRFFGSNAVFDTRRDLRASIGEVILLKTPKRGVASDISVMRANWVVVVSRSFNGIGVLEGYAPETKSYVHGFKFERHAVPSHVMMLLRNLSDIPGSPVHEPGDFVPDGEPSLDVRPDDPVGVTESISEAVSDGDYDASSETVAVHSTQVSYRKALLASPHRATTAMEEEIRMLFGKKKLGHPVKWADIAESNRQFILHGLDAIKDKFSPNGTWIKTKGRIFADGSRQLPEHTGESSSPVARIESIFVLAGIAAFKGWYVIRFDVVCGYPNASRPPEVKYKYLRLNPRVAAIVVRIFPEYASFLDTRGSLIIELDRLLYGMKEAGYYFYLLMVDMFTASGFLANPMDPCLLHLYHENGWQAHNALTVDDCLMCVSSLAARDFVMEMFTKKFGDDGFTFVEGDSIDLLGMQFEFNREKRSVAISQRKYVSDLLVKAGVTAYAKMPCGANLFDVPIGSPPCVDSDLYRSLNQSYAYAAMRTYPECLPAASVYASRFVRATVEDFDRLLKSISYLGRDLDHALVIRPGSLSLVCSADASYGVHADGKSHTGVCVGFKGSGDIPDSFCMFGSTKQSIVTTSSCEAELVAANKGATLQLWGSQLLEGFRLGSPAAVLYRNADLTPFAYETVDRPVLFQDNSSTIHLVAKGRGNFSNTRHIRVRYYFIRDLVLGGELVIVWMSTTDMVADILTKGVTLGVFKYLLPKLIGQR